MYNVLHILNPSGNIVTVLLEFVCLFVFYQNVETHLVWVILG